MDRRELEVRWRDTWVTGAYDPDTNLTYWGTGNPGPDFIGDVRAGDNLYADSLIAVDVDTGALKWHFQFTPHDVNDIDATEIPILLDADFGGRPRKLLLFANRNGFYYIFDRVTGEYLHAKAIRASDVGERSGRERPPDSKSRHGAQPAGRARLS